MTEKHSSVQGEGRELWVAYPFGMGREKGEEGGIVSRITTKKGSRHDMPGNKNGGYNPYLTSPVGRESGSG